MAELNRRRFVQASLALIGAAGLPASRVPIARGAVATTLTPDRRATFTALLGVLIRANNLSDDPDAIAAAVTAFDTEYSRTYSGFREHCDLVLDEFGTVGLKGFAYLTETEQHELLRTWRYSATIPEDPRTTADSIYRHELAHAAIRYAAVPFTGPDEKPPELTI